MPDSISKSIERARSCSGEYVLAINDTLRVLNGKWKLPILASLMFGNKRFTAMQREIPGITPRMLSKELKDLEMNGMVTRRVDENMTTVIDYILTPSGYSISEVLDSMMEWGVAHRKAVMKKNKI